MNDRRVRRDENKKHAAGFDDVWPATAEEYEIREYGCQYGETLESSVYRTVVRERKAR